MDTAMQNETWAAKLIDGLIEQGIDYFCCAPGSRSTPLLLAIANHPKAKKSLHFDERGVCFHAVGYAKACNKPAVVVATSGTAVGNLLPAVMEAYNEHLPLILLTADRPPELRDCGANQTCDQTKLFQNHVRWQIDLPCPDERIGDGYLSSMISHAVAMTSFTPAGPIHINCMFREPLINPSPISALLSKHVHVAQPILHPTEETIDAWVEILAEQKNGVIIAGSSNVDHSEEIFALAERLQWPIFSEILSRPRTYENHSSLITHFDPLLKIKSFERIDAVIQFGDRFSSKTLTQWLEKQTPEFFLHVSDHLLRQDPSHLVTHRAICSVKIFTRELLSRLKIQEDNGWLSLWKDLDDRCKGALTEFFSCNADWTEPRIIWEIASFLTQDFALFLANSMPIRDANQFFLPTKKCGPIFGNRGVSGIDGNIATAAGIAEGCKKPILAILGDLTFLHDLNSLAYLNKLEHPVLLCVINNGGGGIFSFLPVSKRQEAFEEMIAASHEYTFESAAALFKIPYHHPKSCLELREFLSSQKEHPRSCLIEITTDRHTNVSIHQQLIAHLKTCLHLATSHEEIPASLH